MVEIVFSRPGLGSLFLHSLVRYDYSVVFGVLIVFVLLQTAALLLMDLFGRYEDPRLQDLYGTRPGIRLPEA